MCVCIYLPAPLTNSLVAIHKDSPSKGQQKQMKEGTKLGKKETRKKNKAL
jgi:hypothetical protein